MNIFSKINAITEKIEVFILSTSIILMALNTTINALSRYLFNNSIYFSEEINVFLMISVTFVGLAYAVRKGRNIRMTAIYDMLSHKYKKYLTVLIAFVSSIVMFLLTYEAILYIELIKNINRVSPSLQIPMYIVFTIIPIGLAMSGLQYLMRFVKNITHPEIYSSYNAVEDKE